MIDIHKAFKLAEKAIIDNSPTILTAVGVVGSVGTAYLAHQAGYKSAMQLFRHKMETPTKPEEVGLLIEERIQDIPMIEKVRLVWRHYIPVAGVLPLTMGAVVGANRISASRTAALAAAYVLTQDKHEEYKDKVREMMGKKKEEKVVAEIASDKVNANPPPQNIIITNANKVLCLDLWSMTYFESDMETIRKAANDINIQIMNDQYASLSDFYDKLGIEPGRMSDELGWNTDSMLELSFNSVLKDEKTPILTIDFEHQPIRGYGKCY